MEIVDGGELTEEGGIGEPVAIIGGGVRIHFYGLQRKEAMEGAAELQIVIELEYGYYAGCQIGVCPHTGVERIV